MEQNKGVIIALVVVLALFVLALAAGFRPKAGDDLAQARPEKQNNAAAKYGEGGWLSIMDDLLAPLAPSVRVSELRPLDTSCGSTANTLTLTNSTACTIRIDPATDKRRTLSLRAESRTSFLVPGADGELCPAASTPIRIKVRFEMSGNSPEGHDPTCWKPVRNPQRYKTPVLAEGGTLILICEGCGNQNSESAKLLFE